MSIYEVADGNDGDDDDGDDDDVGDADDDVEGRRTSLTKRVTV